MKAYLWILSKTPTISREKLIHRGKKLLNLPLGNSFSRELIFGHFARTNFRESNTFNDFAGTYFRESH